MKLCNSFIFSKIKEITQKNKEINESRLLILEKMNKMEKPLVNLTKREWIQINKAKDERYKNRKCGYSENLKIKFLKHIMCQIGKSKIN